MPGVAFPVESPTNHLVKQSLIRTMWAAYSMGKIPASEAVIDIGSNSVRLVVFGGPARAPITIFNEKRLCGLGRREGKDGRLTDQAMDMAFGVLARFKSVLSEMGSPPVKVVATAAMREASNGPDFIRRIETLGFSPQVLTGTEEARYAALGVLSGAPDIVLNSPSARSHLCGDMGGGSLELVRYSADFENPIAKAESYPLGPLRLIADYGLSLSDAEKPVTKILKNCDWLLAEKTAELHAVGGAWRALARIHQAVHRYPLQTLHHYEMTRDDVIEVCCLIEQQSAESLGQIPGMQRRRIDTLPHAAMVLRLLVEVTKTKSVIISSFGVREGVLYDKLSKQQKIEDPLYAIAEEYARRLAPQPEVGARYFSFLNGLFTDENPAQRRLRRAASMMVDIAALAHPDMRIEQGYGTVLRAPLVALTHGERVTLAAVIYYRYRAKPGDLPSRMPSGIIGEEEILWAKRLGLALRFAADLSPKSGASLHDCKFDVRGERLVFILPHAMKTLFSPMVQKRLDLLAEVFGKPLEIRFY